MLARLVIWALKHKKIKGESKALILNALIENIGALPLKDIVTYDPSGIKINGNPLTTEQVIMIREGAKALEKNWTYQVIKEQVAFEAVKMGVHSSLSLEMVMFSKAALWVKEQEKKLITDLSGNSTEVV